MILSFSVAQPDFWVGGGGSKKKICKPGGGGGGSGAEPLTLEKLRNCTVNFQVKFDILKQWYFVNSQILKSIFEKN